MACAVYVGRYSDRGVVCVLCDMICHIFFFFFQAEDGIRDVAVTGVQTCALPISKRQRSPKLKSFWILKARRKNAHDGVTLLVQCDRPAQHVRVAAKSALPEAVSRSEERRVGKECRSRWSPYH